jgi:hypothetical protein
MADLSVEGNSHKGGLEKQLIKNCLPNADKKLLYKAV